ncbi:MAG: hypothetical protein LC720_06345, partial [Actinobacteria bacterium]|nr:hypothetical protein [Actinomycetota bacterium]
MLATILLAGTAFAAGLTGTWSPCGFSMLATLGPTGHTGGRRTTIAACATFAVGALAGGAATFTMLSALGRILGGGGSTWATGAAVGIAVAAAVGEARGVRVLPQVRRQVPEHWRRVMPLPVAGGLYGILLGLGFTTFVLTLAVWALAGISVALGDPSTGLAVGLAFGAGRALPVVALAPWIDGERGIRYAEMMAERPVVLRGLRLVDGLLLLASAVALGAGAGAGAALAAGPGSAAAAASPTEIAEPATDPSAGGPAVAWAVPNSAGILVTGPGAALRPLGGVDPALGGANLAVHVGPYVTVTAGNAVVARVTVPGATQLAVSDAWLVVRTIETDGRTLLVSFRLPAADARTVVAAEPANVDLGRPEIDGNRMVVAINAPTTSRILEFNLTSGRHRVLRSSRASQLLNPALLGDRLLYERATFCDQRLVLGSPKTPAGGQILLRLGGVAIRDPGYEPGHTQVGSGPSRCPSPRIAPTAVSLWTTALGPDRAYVTELTPRG